MSTVSSLLPLLKRSHGCRFVGKEITSCTSVVLSLFWCPARLFWFSTSLRPSRLKFPLSSCGFPDHRSQCVLTHTQTQNSAIALGCVLKDSLSRSLYLNLYLTSSFITVELLFFRRPTKTRTAPRNFFVLRLAPRSPSAATLFRGGLLWVIN